MYRAALHENTLVQLSAGWARSTILPISCEEGDRCHLPSYRRDCSRRYNAVQQQEHDLDHDIRKRWSVFTLVSSRHSRTSSLGFLSGRTVQHNLNVNMHISEIGRNAHLTLH